MPDRACPYDERLAQSRSNYYPAPRFCHVFEELGQIEIKRVLEFRSTQCSQTRFLFLEHPLALAPKLGVIPLAPARDLVIQPLDIERV